MAITHKFISVMLGVRRAGVTVALQDLVKRGLISMKRSEIEIHDRPGLEAFAGDIYGASEAEQFRLTGWDRGAESQ